MKSKDIRDIAQWATVSAALTIGIVGVRTAVGTTKKPVPTLPSIEVKQGSITYRLDQEAADTTKRIKAALTLSHLSKSTVAITPRVQLVEKTFNGSRFTRTVSVSDFRETVVATKVIPLQVKGEGVWTYDCSFDVSTITKGLPRTYALNLIVGSQKLASLNIGGRGPQRMVFFKRFSSKAVTMSTRDLDRYFREVVWAPLLYW